MTSTFGSVTLQRAKIISPSRYSTPFSSDVTTAGRTTTQGSTQYAAYITVQCTTTSYTDITNLLAVCGQKLTLTVGSFAFTNMKIAGNVEISPNRAGTVWDYTIGFQQETV